MSVTKSAAVAMPMRKVSKLATPTDLTDKQTAAVAAELNVLLADAFAHLVPLRGQPPRQQRRPLSI